MLHILEVAHCFLFLWIMLEERFGTCFSRNLREVVGGFSVLEAAFTH
jgi:hypothetical protein